VSVPDEEKNAEESAEAAPPPITKAEDYPVAIDVELTLPSGARVKLHEPNKYVMLRTGQFPKDVAAAIRNAAEQGIRPEFDIQQKCLETLLCAAFIEPKVAMTPKKGHLCVKDLRDRDREFVAAALQLTVF
jgi:hypothetical protein